MMAIFYALHPCTICLRVHPRARRAIALFACLFLSAFMHVLSAPSSSSVWAAFGRSSQLDFRGKEVNFFMANDVGWHSEVVLGLVHLSMRLNASRTHVFDLSQRSRQALSGSFSNITLWNTSDEFSTMFEQFCMTCNSSMVHILAIVTGESRAFLSGDLMRLPCKWRCVRVLWMCHNLKQCLECFAWRNSFSSELHVPTVFLSPTLRMSSILMSSNIHSIAWIPGFGVRRSNERREWKKSGSVTFLVPGSVNFSKRNYESLRALGARNADITVRVHVFGKCLSRRHCEMLRHLSLSLGPHGINLTHSGGFKTNIFSSFGALDLLLDEADFIFPAIDESVLYSTEYAHRGKLSSSIALALSTAVPLFGWCELLREYRLERQPCYLSSNYLDIASMFRSMMNIGAAEYAEYRMELEKASSDITASAIFELRRLMLYA